MSDLNEQLPGAQRVPEEADTRLDTWKEIAAYLRREVRTVQRWEREQALPVHRHLHRKRGSVYAYKNELDAWWHSHEQELKGRPQTPKPASKPASDLRTGVPNPWWLIGLMVIALAAALVWRIAVAPEPPPAVAEVSPLTTFPGREVGPALSPDGTRIAYAANLGSENYDLFVDVVGAGEPLRITDTPRKETSPEWSPDGRQIAFVRHLSDDGAEIVLMSAMGGAERRIAATSAPYVLGGREYRLLSWSRDQRWLLHCAHGLSEPGRLFRVDVETGEKTPLFEPPPFPGGDFSPSVSPDGKWLAFLRCTSVGQCSVAQVRLTADYLATGEIELLSSDEGVARSPVWTPDGTELVYSCGFVRGRRRLWRSPAGDRNGSPSEVLGAGEGAVVVAVGPAPAGATDGAGDLLRIVYTQMVLDTDIYTYSVPSRPDNVSRQRKIIASTRRDWHPKLSPDGTRIAFASDRTGEYGIWVADANGENPTLLTSFGGAPAGFPDWSPDGAFVLFEAHPDHNADVYAVPLTGGAPIRITSDDSTDARPSWSRDGQTIYFISNRTGRPEVWRTPAPGMDPASGPVQVTFTGAEYATETWDGEWLVYSRGPYEGPLKMLPVSGGASRDVPLCGQLGGAYSFTVAEGRIFYVAYVGDKQEPSICYHDLASGTTGKPLPMTPPPVGVFTATRDGSALIYSRLERLEGDLMVVEGLR